MGPCSKNKNKNSLNPSSPPPPPPPPIDKKPKIDEQTYYLTIANCTSWMFATTRIQYASMETHQFVNKYVVKKVKFL
jgi:hypothetical protein